MASFERNGNRKVRGQLFKRRIPELGYYFIVTDTKETEQNYMFGLRKSIPVNNGELVPSARSNCTTLPKQEYHLAGLLYRSATALCQRCEPLFR